MGSIPSNYIGLVGILMIALTWSTCCFGQAPVPTDVVVSCPNFNCTLSWSEPENITSSDEVTYTVEYENWDDPNNTTYFEIPTCVNIRGTECNLVSVISIDSLGDIHFVAVSAVVNGEPSDIVEPSFIPRFKATLEFPVVNITTIESTSFTVKIHAPLSPYVDPNTGEFYRTNELAPFKKGFRQFRFGHSSVLYAIQPDGQLVEISEESEKSEVALDEEIIFDGLHPYTSYRLAVTSWLGRTGGRLVYFTKKGEEATVNITTLEDVPSEGPVITSIVRRAANCTSPDVSPVVLTWEPPSLENQNGKITHYSIRYNTPGYDFSQAIVRNCSAGMLALELELLRWQAYEFAVLVCNSAGCTESDHKTLFNIQALRKGSKCRNISIDHSNDQTLIISWEPPANFTECITQYLVTIQTDDENGAKRPAVREMVTGDTSLQVNQTLPPGSYIVAIKTFIRSGFDSAAPGDEAIGEFIIEDKTVTNHLILPLVITFSFVFSAILVAIVICAKWILRPFDFHLEKTRALKVARAYHPEPVHYRHTEQEIYDPLPGSRRSSRSSTSSFRPSRSSNPRSILRSDSSSSVGNRLASHSDSGPARLCSHVEEPGEGDALLENITYSPISARKTKKLKCGNLTTTNPIVKTPVSFSSGGSSRRYPMLTIEVPRDSSSPRVVRWKAGGFEADFDEEDDPFDLPKAEDFDEADVRGRVTPIPNCSTDNGNPNGALMYSRLISSDSSSSGGSKQKLNYVTLASQTSGTSDLGGCTPPIINVINPSLFGPVVEESAHHESDVDDDDRVQYARMANAQPSIAAPFAVPNTPGSYANDHSDDTVQYAQMANAQPVNFAAAIPMPSATDGAHIHPYSRIANAERNDPQISQPENNSNIPRTGGTEEYTQLGRADNHQSPPSVAREARTDNVSQPYVELNGNSPALVSSSATPSRNGSSESGTCGVSPGVPQVESASDCSESTQNRTSESASTQKENHSLYVRTSSPLSGREPNVTSDSNRHVNASSPSLNGAMAQYVEASNVTPSEPDRHSSTSSNEASLQNADASNVVPSEPTIQITPADSHPGQNSSPVASGRGGTNANLHMHPVASGRDGSNASLNIQPLPSLSSSPLTHKRHLRERSASDPPYRSVRVPIIHVPGSPLLPSRALDVRVSDSDTSDAESLDSSSNRRPTNITNDLGYVPNGADHNENRNGSSKSAPPKPDACAEPHSQSESTAASENCIQVVNDRLNNDENEDIEGRRTEGTAPNGSDCATEDNVKTEEENRKTEESPPVGLDLGAAFVNGGYVPRS
ncbi:uncharacterized protein [Amphiura filiformis]|uniref:uncharacterized protein n=1 Tax=Amphiura filiformis TaxID=82378 RepID=UPI003B20F234